MLYTPVTIIKKTWSWCCRCSYSRRRQIYPNYKFNYLNPGHCSKGQVIFFRYYVSDGAHKNNTHGTTIKYILLYYILALLLFLLLRNGKKCRFSIYLYYIVFTWCRYTRITSLYIYHATKHNITILLCALYLHVGV